jgi:hypothetical protein
MSNVPDVQYVWGWQIIDPITKKVINEYYYDHPIF